MVGSIGIFGKLPPRPMALLTFQIITVLLWLNHDRAVCDQMARISLMELPVGLATMITGRNPVD